MSIGRGGGRVLVGRRLPLGAGWAVCQPCLPTSRVRWERRRGGGLSGSVLVCRLWEILLDLCFEKGVTAEAVESAVPVRRTDRGGLTHHGSEVLAAFNVVTTSPGKVQAPLDKLLGRILSERFLASPGLLVRISTPTEFKRLNWRVRLMGLSKHRSIPGVYLALAPSRASERSS